MGDPYNPVKKLHLLRWEIICKPKRSGGLGVANIKEKNLACLGKWWWNFIKNRSNKLNILWRSKYVLSLYLEDMPVHNPSPLLKGILDCRLYPNFLRLLNKSQWRWKVGNGCDIAFWKDIWLREVPLMESFSRLFSLARNQNSSVACMIKNFGPQVHDRASVWKRALRGWELDSELELSQILSHLTLTSKNDVLIWKHGSGEYTVKQCYENLMDCGIDPFLPWDKLWKIKVPHGVRLFLWKVSHQILPTKHFLHARFKVDNDLCPWCNMVMEDQGHVLWSCDVISKVWCSFEKWWGISLPLLVDPHSYLFELLALVSKAKCRQAWEIAVTAFLWLIWQKRNDCIFNKSKLDVSSLILQAKWQAFEWCVSANLLSQGNISIWACDPYCSACNF